MIAPTMTHTKKYYNQNSRNLKKYNKLKVEVNA